MILDYPKMKKITEADIRDALDDMVARNDGKPISFDRDLNFKVISPTRHPPAFE